MKNLSEMRDRFGEGQGEIELSEQEAKEYLYLIKPHVSCSDVERHWELVKSDKAVLWYKGRAIKLKILVP